MEYIPRANYPEGLAAKVLELQSQKINPWETFAKTVGKEGGRYFEKKAEKQDALAKFEMDLSKQSMNDVTEGKSMLPEGMKVEDVNPRELYKLVVPNPKYRAFKTNTVNTDAQPAPTNMYTQYKKSFGDDLEEGLTVGEIKALVNMHNVSSKQNLAESKDVRQTKQDRLNAYRLEGASLTSVDALGIIDPEQKKVFDQRIAAHKKEGIALGVIEKGSQKTEPITAKPSKIDIPELVNRASSKKLKNLKGEEMTLKDVVKNSSPEDMATVKKLIKIHLSVPDDTVEKLYTEFRK